MALAVRGDPELGAEEVICMPSRAPAPTPLDLERLSDTVTEALGSTASVIAHTLLFAGAFGLHLLGAQLDEVLLVLTTAVSLEAIYLSIFIQRSTNRQAVRVESAVDEIRRNTQDMLDRLAAVTVREIDDVQEAVEEVGDKLETVEERLGQRTRAAGCENPRLRA